MNSLTLAHPKTAQTDYISALRQDIASLSNDPAMQKQLLTMVDNYFNTPKNQIFRVTHNGGGADCWANTAEFDLLQNDPQLLAKRFSALIQSGTLTVADFFNDPKPDGTKQIDGKRLGQRSGLSLAWDIGCQRMFNASFGANDFQIEKFESWIRGEQTSVVFNGKGLIDPHTNVAHNGNSTLDKLLDSGQSSRESISGIRFSLQWTGAHDVQDGAVSMYHMVVVDHIGSDEKGRRGVFFYQPLNILDVTSCGPARTKVSGNLEFMPIEEFKSVVRATWIPERVLQRIGGTRIVDPAYFSGVSQANIATTEKDYVDGQRPDIYSTLTTDSLRERSQKFFEELSQIQKASRKEA
jgi:hypothetical protein